MPIADFSHGRARNLGAREAKGEIVVLLTQDAVPADRAWLARLLEPFADAAGRRGLLAAGPAAGREPDGAVLPAQRVSRRARR